VYRIFFIFVDNIILLISMGSSDIVHLYFGALDFVLNELKG
jgi:hypothetical protein